MIEGKLESSEQAIKDAWNDHGTEQTEATMLANLMPWFYNAGTLLRSGFEIQSLTLLKDKFASKTRIVLLGSGPSMAKILSDLIPTEDFLLVVGPTGVSATLCAGLKPHVVMVADHKPEQYGVIRDLDPDNIEDWIFVLPVSADPSWYDSESIIKPSQCYFYMPFLKDENGTDNPFNHILTALFPEVHLYIAQAGSVGNAMIGLSEMLCDKDPSKRVYYA